MKPIIFNTKMVKAILEGKNKECNMEYVKPKYKVGDILYVKEKCVDEDANGFCFKEDYETEEWKDKNLTKQYCNHFNARIFLKVTNIRVERLQDKSYEFVYEFERIEK